MTCEVNCVLVQAKLLECLPHSHLRIDICIRVCEENLTVVISIKISTKTINTRSLNNMNAEIYTRHTIPSFRVLLIIVRHKVEEFLVAPLL